MTREEAKKRLEEMEEEARRNDPHLYHTMQLIKQLSDEERAEFTKRLEAEIKRREAAGA